MTAQLVSSYSKALEHGDARRFEVVLLNHDRDEQGQADYMKASEITFPSVRHAKTEESVFSKLAPARYLPTLVLLDADGKELSRDVDAICARLAGNE